MKNSLMAIILFIVFVPTSLAQLPSYVPSEGLIGWWPFNGNANDESGNGNNLTVNGASLSTDRFNNSDKCYTFDGIGDYLHRNFININDDCSVSIWVNMNEYPLDVIAGSSYFSNGYGLANGFGLKYADNKVTVIIYGINYNVTNSIFNQNLNTWYNYVVTKNSDNYSLYINSLLISSGSSLTNTLSGSFSIGAGISSIESTNYQNFFSGKLDDIGFWDRVLSQQEITNLYQAVDLGINEPSIEKLFTIFPNPATKEINVIIQTGFVGSDYYIYDQFGKVILTGNLRNENTIIDLSNLSDGNYLFTVQGILNHAFKVVKE